MEILKFNQAKFIKSVAQADQLPPDIGMEVAFVGRSNSGKSSAINAITNITKLARTSKTPGRTVLINFFQLEADKFLVDLPGYGYAKVPTKVKANWQELIAEYLTQRQGLQGLILTMDLRHPLREFDWQMIEMATQNGLAVHILLNKADKLPRGAANATLMAVKQQLNGYADLVSVQLFSAFTKSGIDEVKAVISRWLSHS
jgi:GTP-binding protein